MGFTKEAMRRTTEGLDGKVATKKGGKGWPRGASAEQGENAPQKADGGGFNKPT